jgi:hypothetical protein
MAKRGGLKRYLERELQKDIRGRYRARIAELRKQAREAKAERKRRLKDARAKCRKRMDKAIAKAQEAFTAAYATERERQKAATLARRAERAARVRGSRERCELDANEIRHDTEAKIALAKKEEVEERTFRRQMEKGAKAQRKQKRAETTKAKVRREESDDRVRSNIPRELVPFFDSMRKQVKGSARMSRTEQFLLYVHEHPDQVASFQAEAVPDDMQYAAQEAAFYAQQHGDPVGLEEVPF